MRVFVTAQVSSSWRRVLQRLTAEQAHIGGHAGLPPPSGHRYSARPVQMDSLFNVVLQQRCSI
ncbi:protein of unknown function [Paraburkholderia dioscoreae]|uniref:Uncharacterized protein n=1 Tax=Paraburkholderia dioscoreae TaxID=2604047 RepID=A0A5Q4ZMF5_9BURK|nr:protein of unknown function [Paraburkholderia dioscoreae]